MHFVATNVTAVKANGKVAKAFDSITEAAQWIHKNRKVAVGTARSNICNASLGRECRTTEPKRKKAYGYIWKRSSF